MEQFRLESLPGPRDGIYTLKITGSFTVASVFDFQAAARNVTEPILLIDLTNVPYMDSASLGSVIGVHVSRNRQGLKYALVGISDRLRALLAISGVEELLVAYPTVEAALAALSPAKSAQAG